MHYSNDCESISVAINCTDSYFPSKSNAIWDWPHLVFCPNGIKTVIYASKFAVQLLFALWCITNVNVSTHIEIS